MRPLVSKNIELQWMIYKHLLEKALGEWAIVLKIVIFIPGAVQFAESWVGKTKVVY